MKGYSNHPDQLERLRHLLQLPHRTTPGQPRNQRKRANKRLKEDEVAALVAGWEAGMSVDELARTFGIHRTAASNHLHKHGIQPDRRGLNLEDRSEAAQLCQQGWTSGMIAKRFGVSRHTVLRQLRDQGVQVRPPGGRVRRTP